MLNIQVTCIDSGEDYGFNSWDVNAVGVWNPCDAYYTFADYGDYEDHDAVLDYISAALGKNETSGEIQAPTNLTYSFRKV